MRGHIHVRAYVHVSVYLRALPARQRANRNGRESFDCSRDIGTIIDRSDSYVGLTIRWYQLVFRAVFGSGFVSLYRVLVKATMAEEKGYRQIMGER